MQNQLVYLSTAVLIGDAANGESDYSKFPLAGRGGLTS